MPTTVVDKGNENYRSQTFWSIYLSCTLIMDYISRDVLRRPIWRLPILTCEAPCYSHGENITTWRGEKLGTETRETNWLGYARAESNIVRLRKQCFFICTVMCLQTVVRSIFIECEIFFFSTMLLEKQNLFFTRINSSLCQSLPPTHPAYAHSNLTWHSERRNKHHLQSRHQPVF